MAHATENNKLESRTVALFDQKFTFLGYPTDGYYNHVTSDSMAESDLFMLARLLNADGNVAVDVGANIGYFTLHLSRYVGDKGRVFSFEPSKEHYQVLKSNLKVNNVRNVNVLNYGLSDTNETLQLAYNQSNRGGAFVVAGESHLGSIYDVVEEIDLATLDSKYGELGIKRCDFLKVDIEGHELHFLQGAKKFLKQFKPAVIMEANHWCLNGLNRVSLPDFIDKILDTFPFVCAFDKDKLIDVREDTLHFMHENIVFNRFQNLYCDFSDERYKKAVMTYSQLWTNIRQTVEPAVEENMRLNNELVRKDQIIEEQNRTLQLLQNSRTVRYAKRARRVMGSR